ncbi:hypothetical protein ACSVIJ_05125 [Pseudomonas sp. NCHU5208]|uniref:hypothetical protein n=1 Tax=unclassified Pseudomonas TaxID=196821 RepID=UPI003F99B84F
MQQLDDQLLAAWNTLNRAAHRIRLVRALEMAGALEELEEARLEFGKIVNDRRPVPPVEKHPEHATDYVGAPDWATCILEGVPSDGMFVYAWHDEDGKGYRGTPHDPVTAHSFFAIVGESDDDEGCGWQVVSTRGDTTTQVVEA